MAARRPLPAGASSGKPRRTGQLCAADRATPLLPPRRRRRWLCALPSWCKWFIGGTPAGARWNGTPRHRGDFEWGDGARPSASRKPASTLRAHSRPIPGPHPCAPAFAQPLQPLARARCRRFCRDRHRWRRAVDGRAPSPAIRRFHRWLAMVSNAQPRRGLTRRAGLLARTGCGRNPPNRAYRVRGRRGSVRRGWRVAARDLGIVWNVHGGRRDVFYSVFIERAMIM